MRYIVDILAPEISHLCCAIHKPFLIYDSLTEEECQRLEREQDELLLEEDTDRDLRLFAPGFLSRFRDYLYGDWTNIYLLRSRIPLSELRLWRPEVPRGCEIYISCIDAAYWEVFAESKSILDRIQGRFPNAMLCKLENKSV